MKLFQIGTNSSAYSSKWMELNKEYTYSLYNDSGCLDAVAKLNDSAVSYSYSRLRVGVMRADMCRLVLMYLHGGVYADLDVIPYKSLKTAIPHDATFVGSEYFSFELIMTVPKHPFVRYALSAIANMIIDEINNCNYRSKCCTGSHNCIIKITGPKAYFHNIINISKSMGCKNNAWVPSRSVCRESKYEIVRRIFRCKDTGFRNNPYKTTFCGIARHADCRNSGIGEKCKKTHYKFKKQFYFYAH